MQISIKVNKIIEIFQKNNNQNFPFLIHIYKGEGRILINPCIQCWGRIQVVRGVDQKDCWKLKKLFGKEQGYRDKKAISEKDYEDIVKAGFPNVKKYEILMNEYFQTEDDLMALLLKVPILDDFLEIDRDFDKHLKSIDSNIFKEYVKRFKTEKGILLERVLYGIVAQN